MKLRLFSFLMAASAILFTACNNGTDTGSSKTESGDNAAATTSDANTGNETAAGTTGTATATPVKEITEHYLHVKNALADDNGTEAANGAKALVASMDKLDQSAFTADQKKVYGDVAGDMKEMAEHISTNANKIDHQREHFVMLSDDVSELVKTFGATQTLYVDHCPMANDNKGANWISEIEEIKNPYMGKKMPKCGKVQEVIKQ